MKKKRALNRKKLIISGIALVIIIAIVGFQTRMILGSFLGLGEQEEIPTVDVSYNNLIPVFSESAIVNDLPKKGAILLKFYNFNTGYREWEKSYIIEKGKITEGQREDVDMIVIVHSKYLQPLNNKNLCSVFQAAKEGGDFAAELTISEPLFLWKYRGALKYRDCFGF